MIGRVNAGYTVLSSAYVWVRGGKTTSPIAQKRFFLNIIFTSVGIFKFQCDPFSKSNVIVNMFIILTGRVRSKKSF
jgi:hypothetical protein